MAGGTPPVAEGTPPMAGGTPPMGGGTPPIVGGTPSMVGGTPPMAGGTPPIAEGTPPMAGGTPPVVRGTLFWAINPPKWVIGGILSQKRAFFAFGSSVLWKTETEQAVNRHQEPQSPSTFSYTPQTER
jgi:hypothetical protein